MSTSVNPSYSSLFLVSGRVFGDDDDTQHIVAAADIKSACSAFVDAMRADAGDESAEVFIIFSASLSEAINDRITAPGAPGVQFTTVITGNVVDGFESCKLFDSPEDAVSWANGEAHLPDTWCLMPILL